MTLPRYAWVTFGIVFALGCSDDHDEHGTEADHQLVGAECSTEKDCELPDDGVTKECLVEFKGGYCGVSACERNEECPAGSACVTYERKTYCFRTCETKDECNVHRGKDTEANCSSSIEFTSGNKEGKVCLPPSGS
ncbi:MAG: hypothetical protein RJA70_361 [Pseudomonadota bacterium]|jgi:hypothetical protein